MTSASWKAAQLDAGLEAGSALGSAPHPSPPALKLCAFCGGKDIAVPVMLGTSAFCNNCRARGPFQSRPTEAIAAWNHRAREADLLRAAAKTAADTLETWKASPDVIEEVSANILALEPAATQRSTPHD